jgi:retron-type reverse transcriptase
VVGNKGSCGLDGMEVTELQEYLSTHQRDLVREVLADNYLPYAIRGVEIPKSNDKRKIPKGKYLGDI